MTETVAITGIRQVSETERVLIEESPSWTPQERLQFKSYGCVPHRKQSLL